VLLHVSCPACGETGSILAGDDAEIPPCPRCGQPFAIEWSSALACPHCGRAIEIGEKDRGKTIVCPGCKYFLGCLLPTEKRTHWRMGPGTSDRPR